MPGGDGTGPNGMGSMSGRGMGFCAGYVMPGRAGFFGGRGGIGRGRGMGGGRGHRNRFFATGLTGWQRAAAFAPASAPAPTREEEVDLLRSQAEYVKVALEDIRKRIDELEKDAAKA